MLRVTIHQALCWTVAATISLYTAALLLTACMPHQSVPISDAEATEPNISPSFQSISSQPSISALSTEAQLDKAILPYRDLDELARRFRPDHFLKPALPPPRNDFVLGDRDTFWVNDLSTQPPRLFQIQASILYMTKHAYWWMQDGFDIPPDKLAASAEIFENATYPQNRVYFGSEWSPGIDNDVRLHIVLGNVPGVAGYYAASNEYSRLADEYSNQREMFLINLNILKPGTPHFDSVLAHEYQHMIHWNQDRNEDTWLNEGMSELAQYINGYGISGFTSTYLDKPDTQLTTWGNPGSGTGIHYGYSFLFTAYMLDQFGAGTIKALVAQAENGVAGVGQTLRDKGIARNFDDLFADFAIANYLNNPNLAQGQWGYSLSGFDLPTPKVAQQHQTFPVAETATLHQYGTDYIELLSTKLLTPTDLMITFSGAQTTSLLNNQAYSGTYQWYSNRGDSIDTTLTRQVDLRGLQKATLKFWAWYDIEADWDFAYVTVSTDQGQTWTVLPATTTTQNNTVGRAYGPGFTGISNGWVEETVDLTAYVGQTLLLRFEYITDEAVNQPGFAVDNLHILELDYKDNVEIYDDGWVAEGFIRTDNILSQHFIVQLIIFETNGAIAVHRLLLDKNNQGYYLLQDFGQTIQRAILSISGQAKTTTNLTQYHYSIEPIE